MTGQWGAVRSVPRTGGVVDTLAGQLPCPVDVTFSGEDVFWTDQGRFGDDGSVGRVPRSGGTATILAAMQERPGAVAADATHVYWTRRIQPHGAIVRVARNGGTPEVIIGDQAGAMWLHLGETDVFWSVAGAGIGSDSGSVLRMEKGGGTKEVLADGMPTFFQVVGDPSALYGASSGGEVIRIPLDGSGAAVLFADGQGASGVALRRDTFHWTSYEVDAEDPGSIKAIPVDGGSPAVVVPNLSRPGSLFADDTHLIWSDRGRGEVMGMAFP